MTNRLFLISQVSHHALELVVCFSEVMAKGGQKNSLAKTFLPYHFG